MLIFNVDVEFSRLPFGESMTCEALEAHEVTSKVVPAYMMSVRCQRASSAAEAAAARRAPQDGHGKAANPSRLELSPGPASPANTIRLVSRQEM